jgi:hypothetical protein
VDNKPAAERKRTILKKPLSKSSSLMNVKYMAVVLKN